MAASKKGRKVRNYNVPFNHDGRRSVPNDAANLG